MLYARGGFIVNLALTDKGFNAVNKHVLLLQINTTAAYLSKYDTMVNDKFTVLPVAVAFESDKASTLSLAIEVVSLSRLRFSRPCHDGDWINEDH